VAILPPDGADLVAADPKGGDLGGGAWTHSPPAIEMVNEGAEELCGTRSSGMAASPESHTVGQTLCLPAQRVKAPLTYHLRATCTGV